MSAGRAKSVQSWLERIWYQRAPPPWWLEALGALYGLVYRVRRVAYAKQWRRSISLACPVLVVGNLTVGGTGKTPLVGWLAVQLTERGFRPGVVTRGYGGSSRQARLIQGSDDPKRAGDEAILLARKSRVPVAVGRNRPAAAQLLIDAGCNIIVSDDGLQHYALARDCEIVVIDGERQFGNGRLLPAGPLREVPNRLKSADVIVVNGGPAVIGNHARLAGALRMRLEATHAIALRYGTIKPLKEFSGRSVHAVAAIGNPQRFFRMLQALGIDVVAHTLPDHARLQIEDISFADDLPVLMTEKDAVKCREIAGPHHWYVPVIVVFDEGDSEALENVVARSIERRAARA
ncbi:MAG: tetraacyldisaccharide 4'-kinase [Pseudomonadota bacterium]|nr:tetraacyldisaccharide 4'-kinase [Pseudomonadota bacterium]